MKLSILIPTITTRYPQPAGRLIDELNAKAEGKPVEILGLLDNFIRSVGEKRNALLDMARGDYICFLDDDDDISDDYIHQILMGVESGADVIVWWQRTVHLGKNYEEMCDYDLDYEYKSGRMNKNFGLWQGKPPHTAAWKASIAKQCRFPDKDCGEDVDFAKQACILAKTQFKIPSVLTTYLFNSSKSETRGDGWRQRRLDGLLQKNSDEGEVLGKGPQGKSV